MFSLLISKVVITTLTFLRNTESIYLFVGNLKTVQFAIFILMCYHLDFRQLHMYLLKLCVNSQSTGDRRVSGLCCTLTMGWVELERLQTFQLSRFGRETHGFRSDLKVSRSNLEISRFSSINYNVNEMRPKINLVLDFVSASKQFERWTLNVIIYKVPPVS